MHTFAAVLALCAFIGPSLAASNTRHCTLTDQQFATAINTLREWSKIHAFHRAHFPPCPDDGMFAEGYSELVVRTLATNWDNLPALRTAANQDPKFKAFVLRHIDATANEADLRIIQTNARSKCPSGSGSLCNEIRKASAKAISELR